MAMCQMGMWLDLGFTSGFELVKQNRFAKIYGHSIEKGPAQAKNVIGFANHFMKNAKSFS